MRGTKGITLISLVITVIILLILAVVAINLAVNSNGLFGKAGSAANKWNTAIAQEGQEINEILYEVDEVVQTLKPMVTKWNVAAGDEVTIYLYYSEDNYGNTLENTTDVTINWGDGTTERYTSSNLQGEDYGYVTHTYEATNTNTTLTITGKCNAIDMEGCTGLIAIEEWGYTESIIYYFSDCTNLATIASPEKNTFRNVTDFSGLFSSCENLTSIPDNMFANCSNVTSFEYAFCACTSLTSIGAHAFDGCSSVTSFEMLFKDHTGSNLGGREIETIGDYAFANCISVTSFDDLFLGWPQLTSIGAHAFDGCSSVTSFRGMFGGGVSSSKNTENNYTIEKCVEINALNNDGTDYSIMPVVLMTGGKQLESIGDYAFANCTSATDFSYIFQDCTSLTSIPEHLFDNTPNATKFIQTFDGCTGLTGNAIPLWERGTNSYDNDYKGTPDGENCYMGCTGLENYAEIPTYWKNNRNAN